jgi:hypothetical protein
MFASSDYSNEASHPKLRINYDDNSSAQPVEVVAETAQSASTQTISVTQGISAQLITNLAVNRLFLDYSLIKDGKTTLQIISSKGTLLKSFELKSIMGKHTFNLELDAALLTLMKETSATIKITQGRTEISFPFLEE